MMNETQVINTLRNEIQTNKAVSDTLYAFAMRQRARHVVTLTALTNKMHHEGFEHTRGEYAEVLKLLAKLNIGKLDTDSKGRVRALKDIDTTLQSIGLAALGVRSQVELAKRRNRFGKIDVKRISGQGELPVIIVSPEASRPPKATEIVLDAPSPTQHSASSVDPLRKPRVQGRPADSGIEWLVVAVQLEDGLLFKSHVPSGLTKADAKKIGQAFLDLAR